MNSKDDHLRKVVNNIITTKEDTPAEKVLSQINYRLQYSRDRREREVLKSILLSVGIIAVANKTNKEFFIKK